MMLTIDRHWKIIDKSDVLFVDDVNAFDEREHLRLLLDFDCPMVFASATPNELRRSSTVSAMDHVVSMKKMPFDVLPTKVHKVEGVWANRRRAAHAGRRAHPRASGARFAHLRHRRTAAMCRVWPSGWSKPTASSQQLRRHGRHDRTGSGIGARASRSTKSERASQ